jgi:hypothetical protein
MCRPSYIFLTSARSRERSSLLAEEFARAFKSFSTASIRRTCAETYDNIRDVHRSKDVDRLFPCFVVAPLRWPAT